MEVVLNEKTCRTLAGEFIEFRTDSQIFLNPFIVLELEELKAKKDLQKIVLLVLMYQISERMYLGSRTQTKSCVIDEAWVVSHLAAPQ